MSKSESADAETREKEENDLLSEIDCYLIDDMILEFCFETHKSLKLNYFDSFMSSKYDGYMRELCDLEKPGPSLQMPMKRKSPADKMNDNVMIGFRVPSGIVSSNDVIRSIEGSIRICNRCKKKARGYDYVSFNENAEKNTNEKVPASENTNSSDILKIRIGDRYFYPEWYLNVTEFFYPGMDMPLLIKHDKEVEISSTIKNKNKHGKIFDTSDKSTITAEIDEDTVISSVTKNIVEAAESLTDSMKIMFFCLECANLEHFLDWLKFILSENSEEETKLLEESKKTVDKTETKEKGDTDIYGRSFKDLERKIYKMPCICMICKRKVGACRYAAHLSNCMGHGRRKSKRLQS